MPVAICPSCRGARTRKVGRIPDAVEFAGRAVGEVLPGGELWACESCGMQFRDPVLSKERLDELYETEPGEAWATETPRRVDWDLARKLIDRRKLAGRILDIGCYDGRFLSSLGIAGDLFGIEKNPVAAARAGEAGVRIIGSDFSSLESSVGSFDVITAFDVVEHVSDCQSLIRLAARALRPGGSLIIATGNTQSFPMRVLGAKHLYVIYPEHLAFVNPAWCRNIAPAAGLEIVETIEYRRQQAGRFPRIKETAINLLYKTLPWLFVLLRRAGVRRTTHPAKLAYPPLWPSARDHFLVVFRLSK